MTSVPLGQTTLMSAPVLSIGEPVLFDDPGISREGYDYYVIYKDGSSEKVDDDPLYPNTTPGPDDDILRVDYRNPEGHNWFSWFNFNGFGGLKPDIDVAQNILGKLLWRNTYDPIISEPCSVTNGRDSAVSLSPPHIPQMECTIHVPYPKQWVSSTTNYLNNNFRTNTRCSLIVMTNEGCYQMFTGLMEEPELYQRNANWFMRVTGVGWSSRLALYSYYNDVLIYTPDDDIRVRDAIFSVLGHHAAHMYGYELASVKPTTWTGFSPGIYDSPVGQIAKYLNGTNNPGQLNDTSPLGVPSDFFNVPLGFYWTSNESPWVTLSRLVATQGPPASFYEDVDGRIVLYGGAPTDRPDAPGTIGESASEMQPMGEFRISDHVADIANRAIVPVTLMGLVPGLAGNIRLRPRSGDDLPNLTLAQATEGMGEPIYEDELRKARNDPTQYPFKEAQGLEYSPGTAATRSHPEDYEDKRTDEQKPESHQTWQQDLPTMNEWTDSAGTPSHSHSFSISGYNITIGQDLSGNSITDSDGNLVTDHQHGMITPTDNRPTRVPDKDTFLTETVDLTNVPEVDIWNNLMEIGWYAAAGSGATIPAGQSRTYRISHGSPWLFTGIAIDGIDQLIHANDLPERYERGDSNLEPYTPGSGYYTSTWYDFEYTRTDPTDYELTAKKINGTDLELTITATSGIDLPSMMVLGRPLSQVGRVDYWDDLLNTGIQDYEDINDDVQDSIKRYGVQLYNYQGMTTIYPASARGHAAWAVRYYYRGIITASTTVYAQRTAACLEQVMGLRPLQKMQWFQNGDPGDPIGLQWSAVRSINHTWQNGFHLCGVTVDKLPLVDELSGKETASILLP